MRLIFWTPVDDCVAGYIPINRSFADLARRHPMIVAASGAVSPILARRHWPGVRVLPAVNVMRAKMQAVYRSVATGEYDALVKLDSECIVFDLAWLERLIVEHVQPMTAAGVRKDHYIRGGCIAAHRTLIEALELPDQPADKEDQLFALAASQAGGELVDAPLFEIGRQWQREAPVWHPAKVQGGKRAIPGRIKQFQSQIVRYAH